MQKRSPTFMYWDFILRYETLILIFALAHREKNFACMWRSWRNWQWRINTRAYQGLSPGKFDLSPGKFYQLQAA